MCRVYGVTRAGYYGWQHPQPGKRATENEILRKKIENIHCDSRGTYGSPRVHRALDRQGCRVSENRVARIMRAHGIKARVVRTGIPIRGCSATTRSSPTVSSIWRLRSQIVCGWATSPILRWVMSIDTWRW